MYRKIKLTNMAPPLKLWIAHIGHINYAKITIKKLLTKIERKLTANVGQINYFNELSQVIHGKTGSLKLVHGKQW